MSPPVFPIALLVWFAWWLARAANRRDAIAFAAVPDQRSPTEKRIAHVGCLVGNGRLDEAVEEGSAWLRDADAGTALLGPAVGACLASVVEACARGGPAETERAVQFGEELLARLRSRPVTGPTPRIQTAAALGRLARTRGDPARAREHFAEALEVASAVPGFSVPGLVSLLFSLAHACRACGCHAEALGHIERALGLQETLGTEGKPLFDLLALLAWVRLAGGEFVPAREAAERALAVAQHSCSEADVVRSGVLECLGRSFLAEGDPSVAVARLKECVAAEERVLGRESASCVSTFYFLGIALGTLGSLPDAARAFEHALHLDALPGRVGPDARREISFALAHVRHEQGELEECRRLLTGLAGDAGPGVVPVLVRLAEVCRELRDPAAEQAHLEHALALAEQEHGSSAAELVPILQPLSFLAWSSCDWFRARDLSARIAAIQRERLGTEHPDLARTLLNQALATVQIGDHQDARGLFSGLMDAVAGLPFRPMPVIDAMVGALQNLQGHPLHGTAYRDLLRRARSLKKDTEGAPPIARA